MEKKSEIEIVKELLMEQLELLSKRSNEGETANELRQFTKSLLETAELIADISRQEKVYGAINSPQAEDYATETKESDECQEGLSGRSKPLVEWLKKNYDSSYRILISTGEVLLFRHEGENAWEHITHETP